MNMKGQKLLQQLFPCQLQMMSCQNALLNMLVCHLFIGSTPLQPSATTSAGILRCETQCMELSYIQLLELARENMPKFSNYHQQENLYEFTQ